jgi:shikimate kinase
MPNHGEDPLLTTAEVAKRAGYSVTHVNRLATRGEIAEAMRLNGRTGARLFRESDVAHLFKPATDDAEAGAA